MPDSLASRIPRSTLHDLRKSNHGHHVGLEYAEFLAKVDVTFSNSLIEAVNKILKYQYLFRKPIADLEHLEAAVTDAITNYNHRPHGALHGLTPHQVYSGQVFDQHTYRQRILDAGRLRRQTNHRACPPCIPVGESLEEAAV